MTAMPVSSSPNASPRRPIAAARTAVPAARPDQARPRSGARPPTSTKLTPASTANRAEDRPAAAWNSSGTSPSTTPGTMCVAIIPTSARHRATSTPTMRPVI